MTSKIFSFGGGVQSTAVMVLQAENVLHYDKFIFANVGDDSENPGTLEYIENVSKPFMEKYGIEFVELGSPRRDGKTLYQYAMTAKRSSGMVVYLGDHGPGHRECTVQYKIKNIERYKKKNGVAGCTQGIGISLDEYQRMRNDPALEYPLIEMEITRRQCIRIIQGAGLPVPPPSSCWFCPFHRLDVWKEMANRQPELFAKAVEMEKTLIDRRLLNGHDEVYFTSYNRPLDQVIGLQGMLDFEEVCESGYCMV